MAASITEMMLPTLLAAMIDRGIGEGSQGFIITAAIIMGDMVMVTCVASIITTVLSAKISTKFAADLRRSSSGWLSQWKEMEEFFGNKRRPV